MTRTISKQTFCAVALATAVIMSGSAPASADCSDVCQRSSMFGGPVTAGYRYMHSDNSEDGYIDGYISFPPSLFSIDYCKRIARSTCNISWPGCSSIWVDVLDNTASPTYDSFVVQCPQRFLSLEAIGLDE